MVVAFRGTNGADLENWISNMKVLPEPYPYAPKAEVHRGFMQAYKAISEQVISTVRTLRGNYSTSKVMVTGHSLGGALALLAALEIKRQFSIDHRDITLYTYG